MKLHYITIFIAGLMLCISNATVAQKPTKAKKNTGLGEPPVVEVFTDYSEALLETDKIDLKYNTGDSLIYPKIAFTYPFIAYDMQSSFSLETIPAISMATDNLTIPDVGYGYLRAGFLHPLTPEADFYLHSPLSKKSAVSIYLKHRSFWGKSPLYDQTPVTTKPIPDEILSAHETTSAGVGMQHLFKHAAIDVKAEYKHQSLLYYGQDTLLLKENIDNGYTEKITESGYVRDFMRQTFNIAKADARIYTLNNVNKIFSFSVQASFDYIKESAHRFGNKAVNQHTAGLNGFFNYKITSHHTLNLQFHGKTYNRDYLSKHFSSGLINVMPSYTYRDNLMRASAGLNIESIYNGHGLNYNFYPFLTFHFITYEGILIPYLEITGGSTLNNYEKIITENPYVLPGLDVSNTRTRIEGEAGARGKFSSIFAYRLSASYAMIDSMYFFVNSTEPITTDGVINNGQLRSNFDVVYDNISKITVGLELSAKFRNLEAMFFSNYTKYSMDVEEKPWHKPSIDAGLQVRYKLNPCIFTLDALYRGETPVLLPASYAAHTTSTKAYINLGLTAEYSITEKFSIFIQGKNLLNRPYQNYYLYYQPGIIVGGGLSYSF